MDRVSKCGKTEPSTSATIAMVSAADVAVIFVKASCMRGGTRATYQMDRAFSNSRMATGSRDDSPTTSSMDMESIPKRMAECCMKATGAMIRPFEFLF